MEIGICCKSFSCKEMEIISEWEFIFDKSGNRDGQCANDLEACNNITVCCESVSTEEIDISSK